MTEHTAASLARWIEEVWLPDLDEAPKRKTLVAQKDGSLTPATKEDKARWQDNAERFRAIVKLLRKQT